MPKLFTRSTIEKEIFQKKHHELVDQVVFAPNLTDVYKAGDKIHVPYERFFGWGEYGGQTYEITNIVDFSHDPRNNNPGRFVVLRDISAASKPVTIAYQAHPKKVEKLVRLGLLEPQTLTGIAIKGLGKYKLKTYERAVKSGIISNKAHVKNELVNLYQDRVALLRGLESLMNHREYDMKSFVQEANKRIEEYVKELNNIKNTGIVAELSDYDENAIKFYEESIEQDIKNANALKAQLSYLSYEGSHDSFRLSPSKKIFEFIVEQSKNALSYVEANNQILAYNNKSRAFDRGDLNTFCVETRLAIDDYANTQHDLHNPIRAEHSLKFTGDQRVVIRPEDHGITSEADREKFVLGVSIAEGTTKLDFDENTLNKKPLRVTRATKWLHRRSFSDRDSYVPSWYETMRIHFYNYVFPGIFISIANFFETLILGEKASVCAKAFFKLNIGEEKGRTDGILDESNDYYALRHKIHNYESHASTTLGLMARKFFSGLIWANLKGVFLAAIRSFGTIPKIWFDAKNGFWGRLFRNKESAYSYRKDIFERLNKELAEINQLEKQAEEKIEKKIQAFTFKKQIDEAIKTLMDDDDIFQSQAKELRKAIEKLLGSPHERSENSRWRLTKSDKGITITKRSDETKSITISTHPLKTVKESAPLNPAFSSYSLEAYNPTGLSNTLVDGLNSFFRFFEEHIYLKHPFGGLIFTAAYGSGVMAILAPALATKIFGAAFVKASAKFGDLLAKGPHSESITVGFGEAKGFDAMWELILHGPDSWLARGVGDFQRDPITSVFAAGFFIGLGYVLTYELNIPFLSAYFRDDVGKAAPIALLVIGAKGGLGIYELLVKKAELTEAEITAIKEQIKKDYADDKKQKGEEIKPEINAQIDREVDEILQIKALHSIFNSYFKNEKIENEKEFEKELTRWIQKQNPERVLTEEETNKIQDLMNRINKNVHSKEMQDLKNFEFLAVLEANRKNLGHLSRELQEDIRNILPTVTSDPKNAESIYKAIDPPKPYAPAGNFVKSVLAYPGLVVRCICSLVTWSERPWKALGEQLKNDMISIGYAVGKLARMVGRIVFVTFPKVVGELFVNLLVARFAGFAGKHDVTKGAYKAAHDYDSGLDKAKEGSINTILNTLGQEATSPHAAVALHREQAIAMGDYKKMFAPASTEKEISTEIKEKEKDISTVNKFKME